MGVPYNGREMTAHPQYLTVRNGRGRDMLDAVAGRLTLLPTQSSGSRRAFVTQTVVADDECALRSGRAVRGCMPAMQAYSKPGSAPV
jgi:7-hydroxymethyl chlorophyll a reductase